MARTEDSDNSPTDHLYLDFGLPLHLVVTCMPLRQSFHQHDPSRLPRSHDRVFPLCQSSMPHLHARRMAKRNSNFVPTGASSANSKSHYLALITQCGAKTTAISKRNQGCTGATGDIIATTIASSQASRTHGCLYRQPALPGARP